MMGDLTDLLIVTLLALAGLGILMATGSLNTSTKEDDQAPKY